jgi:hypothetical protein
LDTYTVDADAVSSWTARVAVNIHNMESFMSIPLLTLFAMGKH